MENVFFKSGITQNQIKELIRYSRTDERIKTNTNDLIRFANKTAFMKWKKIPRKIYTLTNKSGHLLGIIWLRAQALPPDKDYYISFDKEFFGTTFAIRIYGNARGKGLAKDFINKTFKEYKKTKIYLGNIKKSMWLETNADNSIAIKAYRKFGFKVVSSKDEKNRIVMILPQ